VRNPINGAFIVLSAVSAHELTVGIISQLESVLHDLDQTSFQLLMTIFEIFDNYQFA
jgi:ABC-type long-subunit fatty acid transport system fused permease/ATPase subunit